MQPPVLLSARPDLGNSRAMQASSLRFILCAVFLQWLPVSADCRTQAGCLSLR